jgi:hypothetical protein
VTAVLRAVIARMRARLNETPEEFLARRYPHLSPIAPWTDGTD